MFRLHVKLHSFRRLYFNDWLIIVAQAMLLASTILWQVEASILYKQHLVQSGELSFTPGFIDRDTALLRSVVPFTILYYSCVWTVKASLVLFFRRLGSKVPGHKIWWSSIFIITVLAWVACVVDIN